MTFCLHCLDVLTSMKLKANTHNEHLVLYLFSSIGKLKPGSLLQANLMSSWQGFFIVFMPLTPSDVLLHCFQQSHISVFFPLLVLPLKKKNAGNYWTRR
uniref:Uncharacterized protein LOC105643388 n=1 Tax=Rhizophora mucronata TaxID=61149 RepID=A0A2P2KT78_RHIMU